MAQQRVSLKALRNLISQAETILATATLPERRSERAPWSFFVRRSL